MYFCQKPIFMIDPQIEKAVTYDKSFYSSDEVWESSKERIFVHSWQYLGRKNDLFTPSAKAVPVTLLPHYIDEPLLLTQSDDHRLVCLSNVCTHRAFILIHEATDSSKLVCKYHGRRFDLEGKMEFMPEFKEVEDFPRPCDHLHKLPLFEWKGFLFTALQPSLDISRIFSEINERLGFLDIKNWRYAPEYDKIYNVRAHWALYVDNFLEGFHIPFVHNTLGAMIDYGTYKTQCFDWHNLQIGYSRGDTPYFDLPEGHPDSGHKVTAWYYWIFPNFMLNVYPWGLQINVVLPYRKDFTKVLFYHYIGDEQLWESMQGENVADKTQREDEWVVEGVNRGIKSRFYRNGRFSPTREQGVHHFHQLLEKTMKPIVS